MLRTTLAGLRLHKGRLIATALAIVLSVMFVAGTLVFSDTMKDGFSSQVMGSADKLDSAVRPKDDASSRGSDEGPAQLPQRTLDAVADLPEVASAAGVIQGDAPLLDQHGRAVGNMPTTGVSVGEDPSRFSATEGSLPSDGAEVALSTATAESTGFDIGDRVTVLDPDGDKHRFRVSGLIDFGTEQSLSISGAVGFTHDTAAAMTGEDGYSEIDVRGTAGTPAADVANAVADAAGPDAEATTGQELGEELAESAGAQTEFLTTGLLMFAAISVFVAGIVIYNTFAILVAQRQREMALLRCVGARRGQVFRGVLLEALIVALLSSAVGVLAGIGAGWAGFGLSKDALGAGGASAGVAVGPTAVVAGMLVGTVMTLLAALLPAVRATRVAPLAALRTSAMASGLEKGVGWTRTAVAVVLLAVSAALALAGVGGQSAGMVMVTAAGMIGFIGVVVIGPLLVKGVAAVVGAPLRHASAAGGLAADNSRRSPRRAATAMVALTIGAVLISAYSVFSATLQATMEDKLTKQFPSDYVLTGQFGDGPTSDGIDREVAAELRDAPEIGAVYAERTARSELDGSPTAVSTFASGRLGTDIRSDVVSGDLTDVRPGAVAVPETTAGDRTAGDTVRLSTEKGERTYTIAAVTAESGTLAGTYMAPADFASAFPGVGDDERVLVDGAEGASAAAVRDTVTDALADHPTVQTQSTTEMRGEFDDVLEMAYTGIAAMLGLAVLIAVFGIANTMALSVLERTRESAVLRAMGLTGGQLRRMLSLEAVLLCLTGAVVGIVMGVLYGWAGSAAALGADAILTVPTGQVAGFIAAAVVAGLLAAALPARRAARTSITGALASE